MIHKDEILLFSKRAKLDPSIIEKDYVLGWILRGIYHQSEIKNTWIFKGRTSLKKCFFHDYRFSEDLDFTIINTPLVDLTQLRQILVQISEWVVQTADTVQATIKYNGPLRRKTNLPRIKLDLSFNEKLVLQPEQRSVYHPYSDKPLNDITISCYSFEEIFAEKIRALAERARSRDLYDVVHLYKSRERLSSKELLLKILKEKCHFKRIPLPGIETIQTHPNHMTLITEWKNMLSHQLPDLETFEEFWSQVPTIFSWLYQEDK